VLCRRCASDKVKNLSGELAIHFPGLEGLDKPIVWVYPKLAACLNCGFAELVLPDEQRQQLKHGGSSVSSLRAS
jgi:hypothetical protein